MTKEEKQLLLIDLCAREPYHPRIQVFNQGYEGFQDGEFDTNLWLHHIDAFRFDRIEILPYLRSMSSMTEEEFINLTTVTGLQYDQLKLVEWDNNCKTLEFYLSEIPHYYVIKVFDWLNAHHFDYRGLITMGLAIEAKEGMYKTE